MYIYIYYVYIYIMYIYIYIYMNLSILGYNRGVQKKHWDEDWDWGKKPMSFPINEDEHP